MENSVNNTCPAVKYSCKYFDSSLKNRCGLKTPTISKNGRHFYCKSHIMSKEIKDIGIFSMITEGSRAV